MDAFCVHILISYSQLNPICFIISSYISSPRGELKDTRSNSLTFPHFRQLFQSSKHCVSKFGWNFSPIQSLCLQNACLILTQTHQPKPIRPRVMMAVPKNPQGVRFEKSMSILLSKNGFLPVSLSGLLLSSLKSATFQRFFVFKQVVGAATGLVSSGAVAARGQRRGLPLEQTDEPVV